MHFRNSKYAGIYPARTSSKSTWLNITYSKTLWGFVAIPGVTVQKVLQDKVDAIIRSREGPSKSEQQETETPTHYI